MVERTRAIIVGVDGYGFAALSSAVNDAVAVFKALTSGGPGDAPPIVPDAGDVTLLASPAPGQVAPPGSLPATQDNILDALRPLYAEATAFNRLIFYFSGHGMTASRDGRVGVPLILPSDVLDPERGKKMISVQDLLDLFSQRGPMQQLWIIDACRDMPYERRPRGWEIDWPDELGQGKRAQAAIYAVSQGGKALSVAGGQGRFTGHLLNALQGKGSAADYVPELGHCVTVHSLYDYLSRRSMESLAGYDDWTRTVQAPDSQFSGLALKPLKWIPRLLPKNFSVQTRPPEALANLDLLLEFERGVPLSGWPPTAPQRLFELRASLKPGADELWQAPQPEVLMVDLREVSEVTLDVARNLSRRAARQQESSAPRKNLVTTGSDGSSGFMQDSSVSSSAAENKQAIIHVKAADGPTRVRLKRAEYPWTVLPQAAPNMDIVLDPGAWDLQTTLGDEVISSTRLLLAPGERRTMASVAQISPLVASLLPPPHGADDDGPPEVVMPSETIGPMQGAILPTLLPLLALKPFDTESTVLRRLAPISK